MKTYETKYSESVAYKAESNNNIVFLPMSKVTHGKTGSYTQLDGCEKEESRRNGNNCTENV